MDAGTRRCTRRRDRSIITPQGVCGNNGPENAVESTIDLRTISGSVFNISADGSFPSSAGPVDSVWLCFGAGVLGLLVEGFERGIHVTTDPF